MKRTQLDPDPRHVLEHLERFIDCELEHVRDGVASELDLLDLARVARAVTHLAGHVHVGQEVHLDLDDAVALTRLAPPALHVEAEAPGLVTAHLGLGKAREQIAHVGEHSRVRRRVRPRCAADRRLVDVDSLVQVLEPVDLAVRPRLVLGPVEELGDAPAEDVGDQRRLA